jgi:hypothetical protein
MGQEDKGALFYVGALQNVAAESLEAGADQQVLSTCKPSQVGASGHERSVHQAIDGLAKISGGVIHLTSGRHETLSITRCKVLTD